MHGHRLTLQPDDDNHEVWLITESASGTQQTDILCLRAGFCADDVRAALAATGWVRQDGDAWRFTGAHDRGVFRRSLSDLLEDVFSYFQAPDEPTDELRQIQSAVAAYEGLPEPRRDIPPYAYAWLDIMLREDIADEARGAKDIWARSEVVIELDRVRESWIDALLRQYVSSIPEEAGPVAGTSGRMARSFSTRKPEASPDAKTG